MEMYASVLVCIVGLLIYALANQGKVVEVGRLMFFAGLLAFLLGTAGKLVNLLGR